MNINDWYYNGLSRNDLAEVYVNLCNQNGLEINPNMSQWGRCSLARELEALFPVNRVFG